MSPNPQFPEDVVTFTGETLNGKLCYLCSDISAVVCIFNYIIDLNLLKKRYQFKNRSQQTAISI